MTRFMIQGIKFHYMKALRLMALVMCGCFIAYSANAAGLFADDPCDDDYYESLEARAWLEAQREITQNQNLIFKPDSVLEYTCFDSFLGELVDHAGFPPGPDKLFSGNNRWGNPPTDMNNAISDLVGAAIDEYDTSNFDHDLLGGRHNVGSNLNGAIIGGDYACDIMDEVWMVAKCMDFVDNSDEDGFFTFAEYAADPDKRFLPDRCDPKTADFQADLDTALAEPPGPSGNSTPWEEDDVETYFDLIFPQNGCGANSSAPNVGAGTTSIVSTGLVVERSVAGVTRYNEYICVVPGCHYVPTGLNTGNCQQ